MALNKTTILSDSSEGSKQQLSLLIQQNIVFVIIFGNGVQAQNAVQTSDACAMDVSGIGRKVIWIQNTGLIAFLKSLIKQGDGGNPANIDSSQHIGIAISLDDKLMDIIPANPAPDAARIELAFLQASA